MIRKTLLLVALFCCLISFAQTQDFTISGKAIVTTEDFKNKDVTESMITVYRDSIKMQEVSINPKTGFRLKLEYEHVYCLAFTAMGCHDMFMIFDTKAPAGKRTTKGNDLGAIPFFSKKIVPKTLHFMKWVSTSPFNVYEFNGNDGFEEIDGYKVKVFRGTNEPATAYKGYLQNIQNRPIPVVFRKKEAKSYDISGKILVGAEPQIGLKTTNVKLVNDKGETVETSKTNRYGKFFFKKLKGDKEYVITVDEGNTHNPNGKATLVNKYDNVVDNTQSDASGRFKFKLLAGDTNKLNMLSVEDNNLVISGNLLAMLNGKASPISKKKLNLVIKNNEIIETTETNEFGTFVFTKLPQNENFLIRLAEDDPSLAGKRILITDRNGKTVHSTDADAKGGFKFEFLEPEKNYIPMMEVDDADLRMNYRGKLSNGDNKNAPMGNMAVSILTEDNKTVSSSTTDGNGNFTFSYIEKAPLYLLSGQTKQPVQKVVLADAKGVLIKEYNNEKKEDIIRIPLLPVDQNRLSTVFVDDPWLKIIHKNSDVKAGHVIPEKVYFEVNDFKITSEAEKILDKVIQVMKSSTAVKIEISAHTDAQGSDQANMDLSQKRAKSAVDYMVAQGIDKVRLTAIGHGETKLINRCKNNVACSEDEHAQNRRLEFKIISQ